MMKNNITTNIQKYIAVFDAGGKRITSYALGIHGDDIDALKALAIQNYPDATPIEMTPSENAQYVSGKYRYDISTKSAVEIIETEEEKLTVVKNTKLIELQGLLHQTDYQAIKYAEGALTDDQYSYLKKQRESWRSSYNAIQSSLTLDAVNAVTYSTEIPVIESI
jgi:hypothetical protein